MGNALSFLGTSIFLVEAWFGVRMSLKFGEGGSVSFKAQLDCIGKDLCLLFIK